MANIFTEGFVLIVRVSRHRRPAWRVPVRRRPARVPLTPDGDSQATLSALSGGSHEKSPAEEGSERGKSEQLPVGKRGGDRNWDRIGWVGARSLRATMLCWGFVMRCLLRAHPAPFPGVGTVRPRFSRQNADIASADRRLRLGAWRHRTVAAGTHAASWVLDPYS